MTAEPDLLPSSVAAFTEALHGERGSLDAWLEVNDEREVAAHIEAYASARVARATAELEAEMQALAATADAGFRDGWNRAAAARDAEIEALRAEVESVTCELMDAITRADKLAEALRDAEKSLRTIANLAGGTEYLMTIGDVRGYANSRAYAARAALRDHDQEVGNG